MGVYAAELGQIRALPRRKRTEGERDHFALSSAMLDGVAESAGDAFRDGSIFGLTSASAVAGEQGSALEDAVARWFCARLNEELRGELTHSQHLTLAGEFEELSRLFAAERLAVHAEVAARSAARHLDNAGLPDRADEARYRARLRGMGAIPDLPAQLAELLRRWTSGFGYRPYRLLPTAALVIAAATAMLALGGMDRASAFQLSVNAYFGWLGTDDVGGLGRWLIAVPYCVTVASILINSTIVALLARRWFRI